MTATPHPNPRRPAGPSFTMPARDGDTAVAIAAATAISYAGNRCWTFRHRQHIPS